MSRFLYWSSSKLIPILRLVYKASPLVLPQLIPLTRGYAGVAENLAAWEVFRRWQKPFLTAFTSDENMLHESATAIPGGHSLWQETVDGPL